VRGIESAGSRVFGWNEGGVKARRPGRLLIAFKAFAVLSLAAAAAFGLMADGLYDDTLWLPVAACTFGLLFATVLARGFYDGVSRQGWVLVSLLALLVLVKGLSMIWTISETETIKEAIRASMYLAAFAIVLAVDVAVPRLGWVLVVSLAVVTGAYWESSYWFALLLILLASVVGASAFARGGLPGYRQVGPLVDGLAVAVAAVAGYGLLQKTYPADFVTNSLDGYRVDSTLGYPNSAAVVLGMGAVLALSRMTATRNPLWRGLFAVLMLGSLVTLYLTLSRGGIGSFGIGLIVLFALGNNRLQMLANLVLVSVPGAWIWWRMQDLATLLSADAPLREKVADGTVFRNDLIVAFVLAFVLQAAYAFFVSRYELTSIARRYVGIAVGAFGAVAALALAVAVVVGFGGVGQAARTIFSNPDQQGNAAQRLVSLGVGFRAEYWNVGWDAWLERPFTGTGAGTFQYTWLEGRQGVQGVKQVHNLYLEQGTETGLVAFLALVAFTALLLFYIARAAWRHGPEGEGRLLLAGLTAAVTVYLTSSVFEWHWYLPGSTLFFFVLAAAAARLARTEDRPKTVADDETPPG
jgi:O-antigen ligase